jgi:uncharacterized repeat protein (TIGR01451 family)
MGLSTGANAATATDTTKAAGAINNVATASYSVGTVVQPTVTSNTVTVTVNETANFSLIATNGNTVDTNANQAVTLNGKNTFVHSLSNTGNVTDTYIVTAKAANEPTLDTVANQNYLFKADSDTIAFVIKRTSDGTALTLAEGQALGLTVVAGNITSGGTIKLAPGLTAELTYQASLPSANQIGGNTGVGTLTASSTFIGTGTILTNENQSIVRLPVFSIVKRVTKTLNLSDLTDEATYTITVKNNKDSAYAADATNIKIIDSLPAGLKLVAGSIVTTVDNSGLLVTSGSQGTVGNAAVTSSKGTSSAIDSFEIGNVNLPVGAIVTVTFRVLQDAEEILASPTINHARVAALVGNVTIIDSTDNTDPNENTATYYPANDDIENTNGTTPTGTGDDSTQPLSTVKRALAISNPTTREIAPASGTASQITHTAIITNTGRDAEGTAANPLSFTILDDSANANVRPVVGPVNVTYTPAGSTTSITRSVSPTTTDGNTYTLNDTTLPAGGILNGGTFTISYNVSSGNVTTPTDVTKAAAVGSTETTIVTLTPTGTGAPAATTVNDTTNVRGLTLLKQAAVQVDCSGTIPAYQGTFGAATTLSTPAKPGDCIHYKVTANNTFTSTSGTSLAGVTLSDLTNQWKSRSTYQSGTATGGTGDGSVTIANPGVANTEAVTTNLGTLASGASGSMTFFIKVNP